MKPHASMLKALALLLVGTIALLGFPGQVAANGYEITVNPSVLTTGPQSVTVHGVGFLPNHPVHVGFGVLQELKGLAEGGNLGYEYVLPRYAQSYLEMRTDGTGSFTATLMVNPSSAGTYAAVAVQPAFWSDLYALAQVQVTSPAGVQAGPGGERRSVAVVVENTERVNPSGLSKADVVFEVQVAPGATRFLAFFTDRDADVVGPVRSLRPQLLNIARGYDAPVAHAGGDPESLQTIRADGTIKSLDEIYGSGYLFWRGPGSPPDNLFTSTTNIRNAGLSLGFDLQLPLGEMHGGVEAPEVLIQFPTYYGEPTERGYKWDPASGRYLRYMHYSQGDDFLPFSNIRVKKGWGGQFSDGVQLSAANVIVLRAPYKARIGQDGYWMTVADLVGEGDAEFYRDGKVWFGRWRKPSPTAPFEFLVGGRLSEYTAPMVFASGPTWVEVVPSEPLIFASGQLQTGLEAALALLRQKAPEFYRFVGCWALAVAEEDLPRFPKAAATVRPNYRMIVVDRVHYGSSDPSYLAGLLVHETAHISQHWQGEFGSNLLSRKLTGGSFGGPGEALTVGLATTALCVVNAPVGVMLAAEALGLSAAYGNLRLSEVDACNQQLEALREIGAPQWVVEWAQEYRLDNQSTIGQLVKKFVDWWSREDQERRAKETAEHVLRKYLYELTNLVPGVSGCAVTRLGNASYAIEVSALGGVALPSKVEGVPIVVRPPSQSVQSGQPPTLHVSPSRVRFGEPVTVIGFGFTPGAVISISLRSPDGSVYYSVQRREGPGFMESLTYREARVAADGSFSAEIRAYATVGPVRVFVEEGGRQVSSAAMEVVP